MTGKPSLTEDQKVISTGSLILKGRKRKRKGMGLGKRTPLDNSLDLTFLDLVFWAKRELLDPGTKGYH